MRIYSRLVRIFLRSGVMEELEQKHKKTYYAAWGIVSIVGIMLPCCVLVGAIAYALTLGMGGAGEGIIFLLHLISLFAVIFGTGVILNVFYFSGDIPHILPLPVSPTAVIAAKFTVVYITESAMEMMLLASVVIGFFLAAGGRPALYPAVLIGCLTLPLTPLCYSATVCVALMATAKWIHNKNAIRRCSVIFNLGIVAAAVWGLGMLRDLDLEGIAQQLETGQLGFSSVLNRIFPVNDWFGQLMAGKTWLYFVWYVLFHFLVLAVFLITAKLLYYRGLMAVGAEGSTTVTVKKRPLHYGEKKRSPWAAYLQKELKVLIRTPSFFLNCIAVNLLWPGLGYVIVSLQSESVIYQRYIQLYRDGNEAMQWIATLLVLGISVLLTAANSIASSSVTREGKQYYVMKYLPVSYKLQLHVKALASILVSGVFALLFLLAAACYIRIPVMTTLYYALTALQQIVFISYFGVLLDTVQPKLIWEDEVSALRANRNVFFNMAYAMLITTVFLAALFAFYRYTKLPLALIQFILFLLLSAADIWMMLLCTEKGAKNIQQM